MKSFPLHLLRSAGLVLPLVLAVSPARAQISSFTDNGLVGVGSISATTVDTTGQDYIGGIFSAMAFDQTSLHVSTDGQGNKVYTGTLFGQSDRGFNLDDTGQTTDFHGRLEGFSMTLSPTSGSPGAEGQIVLNNTTTKFYTDPKGNLFTGLDANSISTVAANGIANLPQASSDSHLCLDSEGLALAPDGTSYVSEEYGPIIYHLSATGQTLGVIIPPAAYTPISNGVVNYSAAADPTDSGRTANGGLEGLSITPDGQYLIAALQRPLVQDGGSFLDPNNDDKTTAKNTRILQFYLTGAKAGQLAHEYVYTLHVNTSDHNKNTGVSEILALNDTQFLVLDRDTNGRGTANNNVPSYKKVVAVDTTNATDIAGTGFDQRAGTTGQFSFPVTALASTGTTITGFGTVVPVAQNEFLSLIDTTQLGRFGQNVSADWNKNKNAIASNDGSVPEKLEGMALIPENDPTKPNNYLLMVGSDNDYITANGVLQNGAIVPNSGNPDITSNGASAGNVRTKIYAYDVTLPGASVLIPPASSTDTPVLPPWGIVMLGALFLLIAFRYPPKLAAE